MEINNILNGLLNSLFPNKEINEEAKRRLYVCLLPDEEAKTIHCRYYNENKEGFLGPKCNECGCFLKYKIKSENSKCPVGKWEK